MLRKTWIGAVLVVAVLCGVRDVLAWNALGHMMVARQAWDEMSPAGREKASEILRKLPHYETLVQRMPADYADKDAYAFMQAAVWPDEIRSKSHPMSAEHRPVWHYVNYPVNPEKVEGANDPIETWDGTSDPINILQALEKNKKDLADAALPAERRAIALCWVLHLVGDIHQPLHATALFGKQFPAGDKGGNSFIVKGPFGQTGLHSLWDNMLGVSRNVDVVEKDLDRLRKDPKLSKEPLKDAIAKSDGKEWAKESYELAVEYAYQNAQLAGASQELLRANNAVEVPALPVGYMERAREVAELRTILAGDRLAAVVETAVGK